MSIAANSLFQFLRLLVSYKEIPVCLEALIDRIGLDLYGHLRTNHVLVGAGGPAGTPALGPRTYDPLTSGVGAHVVIAVRGLAAVLKRVLRLEPETRSKTGPLCRAERLGVLSWGKARRDGLLVLDLLGEEHLLAVERHSPLLPRPVLLLPARGLEASPVFPARVDDLLYLEDMLGFDGQSIVMAPEECWLSRRSHMSRPAEVAAGWSCRLRDQDGERYMTWDQYNTLCDHSRDFQTFIDAVVPRAGDRYFCSRVDAYGTYEESSLLPVQRDAILLLERTSLVVWKGRPTPRENNEQKTFRAARSMVDAPAGASKWRLIQTEDSDEVFGYKFAPLGGVRFAILTPLPSVRVGHPTLHVPANP